MQAGCETVLLGVGAQLCTTLPRGTLGTTKTVSLTLLTSVRMQVSPSWSSTAPLAASTNM